MKVVSINKMKISLILNYLIFIFVVISAVIMFTGYKITYLKEPVLETTGLGVFKFFTVDSNILVGISAILLAHQERKKLNGKKEDITVIYYMFKYITTVSVTVTFLTVFFYLGTIVDGGIISLLQNSNMFFHLVIPLLSILSFVLFEKTNKIKFSYTICGLIPVLIYGIYYLINIFIHIENGKILPKYDWYHFLQGGMNNIYVTASIIIVLSYLISIILWFLNKKAK